jgi:hypothetical protein
MAESFSEGGIMKKSKQSAASSHPTTIVVHLKEEHYEKLYRYLFSLLCQGRNQREGHGAQRKTHYTINAVMTALIIHHVPQVDFSEQQEESYLRWREKRSRKGQAHRKRANDSL